MKPIHIIGLLKTEKAVEESGERILYIEASREDIDTSEELVLCRALRDSADYFLKFGNVDLDHESKIRNPKVKNPYFYEIGKPIEVKTTDDNVTLVKVQLYSGTGDSAQMANYVWSSLTEQTPPQVWYASIGGQVTQSRDTRTPDGKEIKMITGVCWNNLALSKNPCLQTLNPSSLTPIGAFAKSELALALAKSAETAEFAETDSAQIEGFQSLIMQSLDQDKLFESIAQAILDETISGSQESIIQWLMTDYNQDQALLITHQFLSQIRSNLNHQSTPGELMKNKNRIALAKALEDDDKTDSEVTEDLVEEVAQSDEEEVIEEVTESDEEVKSEDEVTEEVAESDEDEEEVAKSDPESDEEEVTEVEEEVTEEVAKSDGDVKLDSIIDSLNAITSSLNALTETLTNHINSTEDTFKTINTNVATIQKAGLGRRSAVISTPKLSTETVLAKCLALQADKKITASDTILIDDSIKKGLGIPDKFRQYFSAV